MKSWRFLSRSARNTGASPNGTRSVIMCARIFALSAPQERHRLARQTLFIPTEAQPTRYPPRSGRSVLSIRCGEILRPGAMPRRRFGKTQDRLQCPAASMRAEPRVNSPYWPGTAVQYPRRGHCRHGSNVPLSRARHRAHRLRQIPSLRLSSGGTASDRLRAPRRRRSIARNRAVNRPTTLRRSQTVRPRTPSPRLTTFGSEQSRRRHGECRWRRSGPSGRHRCRGSDRVRAGAWSAGR